MTDEALEALDRYVVACGGDPKNRHTESMEARVAREELIELLENDDGCPC